MGIRYHTNTLPIRRRSDGTPLVITHGLINRSEMIRRLFSEHGTDRDNAFVHNRLLIALGAEQGGQVSDALINKVRRRMAA